MRGDHRKGYEGYITESGDINIWEKDESESDGSGCLKVFLIIMAIDIVCGLIGMGINGLHNAGILKYRIEVTLYETDPDYDISKVTLRLSEIDGDREYTGDFDTKDNTASVKAAKGEYSLWLEQGDYRLYWHNITIDGSSEISIPDWAMFFLDDTDMDDGKKMLLILVQTGSEDIPEPDITAYEVSSGETITFTLSSEREGTISYKAYITEGTWEVIVSEDADLMTATIEVTDDYSMYLFASVMGYYEDDDDEEEPEDSAEEEVCIPDDAVQYNDHSYYIYETDGSVTWEEAKKLCEKLGGYLMSVNSVDEAAFIAENMPEGGDYYWVGGYYSEGWQWLTGESMDYTAWINEPSESVAEIYGYVGISENGWQYFLENGIWNSTAVSGYICEWDQ